MGRAGREAGRRHPWAAVSLHGEGGAEIGNQRVAVLQQDVFGLDVAVNDVLPVGVAEGVSVGEGFNGVAVTVAVSAAVAVGVTVGGAVRVKVGVGKAGGKLARDTYVLTAFAEESRIAIDPSILTATAHLLDMMGRPSVAKTH